MRLSRGLMSRMPPRDRSAPDRISSVRFQAALISASGRSGRSEPASSRPSAVEVRSPSWSSSRKYASLSSVPVSAFTAGQYKAARSVDSVARVGFGGEAVTDSPDRVDVHGPRRIRFEQAPEPHDDVVDRPAGRPGIEAPYLVEYLVTADDLTFVKIGRASCRGRRVRSEVA